MSRGKILIVDDDKHLAMQVRDLLRHEGYEIAMAHDGEQGLAKLQAFEPDLIILDMGMPALGGLGFLKRLAELSLRVTPDVIVFTIRSDMSRFFEGLNVSAFLAKPCDGDSLLSAVRRTFATRPGQQPVSAPSARKRPVLLVAEDDEEKAVLIVKAFSNMNCDVVVARDGPDALDKATQERPDVLLAKTILTGMNGVVLAKSIAETESTRDTRVVLYDDSGMDSEDPRLAKGRGVVNGYVRGGDVYALATEVRRIMSW